MTDESIPQPRVAERVTFWTTEKSRDALNRTMDLTGDTATDSVNRAVQVYDFLVEVVEHGGEIFIQRVGDAEPQSLAISGLIS